MRGFKFAVAAFAGALLFGGPALAFGDMGRSPVAQGNILSGEGGFFLWDQDDISGYGVSNNGINFKDISVSPEDGWFAGGMIGHASTEPIIPGLWFTRIEGYGLYMRSEDSVSSRAPNISLASVNGNVLVVAPNDRGHASVERENIEGGLHFERDRILSDVSSITWVVAPFIRLSDEDAEGNCSCGRRTGDVDTWLYGVVFAAEPERWVTPGIALVGRLGVGFYGFDADGKFRSQSFFPGTAAFNAKFSDSDSGVGFRGQLGAGLKFKVWNTGMLETFAEADYFSDIGIANLPNNTPAPSARAHIDSDDVWELRAGARLTFAISGSN